MRDKFIGDSDDDDTILEFENDSPFTGRSFRLLRWMRSIILRTLPVLALMALLLAVAGQPELALLFHRSPSYAPVPITVICDVPWAVIRVDGRGGATRCASGIAGALPMARLSVDAGQHTLVATAEGFVPYSIYIIAHPNTPGLYLTQFALTPEGSAQALDAVNAYFASAYTQDVIFPAALWQTLGLSAPPAGSSLLVRERFEAVSLDSYDPVYSETTYQRPVAPERGMLGVAVVVKESVSIYNGCGATPLLERSMPVLYATRASVTFSVAPGPLQWSATKPYILNPDADIFTGPAQAARPASPSGLLAVAARTDLSSRLGSWLSLADAVLAAPLTSASQWATGVVLTLHEVGHPDVIWLYISGVLLSLTSTARTLSATAPILAPPLTLDDLRANLVGQPLHLCGGT